MGKVKNVVLGVSDSLRRDAALDVGIHRASKGLAFECVAQANCTPAAISSIITGLNPQTHLMHRFDQSLDPFTPTIFSILKERGYETNYLSLGRDTPITECQEEPLLGYMNFPFDPSKKLEYFLRGEQPFALFLHFWDTHTPYLLEDKTGAQVDELFAQMSKEGKLPEMKKMYWDSVEHLKENKIRPIIELLERHGRTEDTLFILMGDHGEMLGEKYEWANYDTALVPDSPVNHVGVLVPETIDVPLIAFNPSLNTPKEELTVRQVDVLSTILSQLGIAYSPQDFEGVNIFDFKGILASFSIGVHPHTPRYLTKKREDWVSWIDEPLFRRVSVRVLDDFYVSTERGEVLANFRSKQQIHDETRMEVLRAYTNRFKHGRYKGIVSTKNPITSGKVIFDGKGAGVIKGEGASAEEDRRRMEDRLRRLGYM